MLPAVSGKTSLRGVRDLSRLEIGGKSSFGSFALRLKVINSH